MATTTIEHAVQSGPGGTCEARVTFPTIPTPGPGEALWVTLDFVFDRVPPVRLTVADGQAPYRVTDVDGRRRARWTARLDSPPDAGLRVGWVRSGNEAQLVGAELSVAGASPVDPTRRADATPFPTLADYRATLGSLQRDDDAVRRAREYFLKVDLTTSLGDDDEVVEIAGQLEVDDKAWFPVDPVRRDHLAAFLVQRWTCRAVAAKHRAPTTILPTPSASQYELATRVTRLMLDLFHDTFGAKADTDGWDAMLMFANGELRLPVPDDRLNCEPNSLAIASFAEVVDIAADRYTELEGTDLVRARRLRRMFVSMIEPYAKVYVATRVDAHRGCYYSRTNFDASRRMSRRALTALRKEYAALSEGDLLDRWGKALGEALADEWCMCTAVTPRGGGGGASPSDGDEASN